MAEVAPTIDLLRFAAREAPRVTRPRSASARNWALWRKRLMVWHEPFGVIGVVSPWNYPLLLPAGPIAAALATGNGVICKPSELTPRTVDLFGESLRAGGVPEHLLAVVHGDGAAGSAVVHAALDKVFFIGSPTTGRKVAVACAEADVPCVTELGGSDAAIVLSDADIGHAASGILWGRFANAGQTCVAPKRVFVESTVYEAFVAALTERVHALKLSGEGDGSYDVGPVISEGQRERVQAQLADAWARGSQAVEHHRASALPDRVVAPTILLSVPSDAVVMHEETFGPVLPIQSVDSLREAIMHANDSEFALSASVWSRDRRKALAVASVLRAGSVMINDVSAIPGIAEIPHGGVGRSGSGRTHGIEGLLECVRSKSIVDDRFTSMRQAWWFGYTDETLEGAKAFLQFSYDSSLAKRLRAIPEVLRLMFRPRRPL